MKKTAGALVIFMLLLLVAAGMPAWGAGFNDMQGHWAANDVNRMSSKGIIFGDGRGNFNPNNRVSREEIISMLIRLLEQEGQLATVQPAPSAQENWAKGASQWAIRQLTLAKQLGIIDDYQVRVLAWNESATRQEVAIWLARAVGVQPLAAGELTAYLSIFKDANAVNFQEAPYLMALVRDQVIVGQNGFFKPLDFITRGETAAILNRADIKYPHKGLGGGGAVANSYIRGSLRSIDWLGKAVELEIGGNQLKFAMTDALVNQLNQSFWQQPMKPGDQVELFILNGLATHINVTTEVRPGTGSSSAGRGDYVIYKATLSSVNTQREQITLRSGTVRYLDGRNWRSVSGQQTFDLERSVELYNNTTEIALRSLSNFTGETVYLAVDERSKTVAKLRVQSGTELTPYDDEISQINTRSQWVELYYENHTFNYDRGSIVIIDGYLMRGEDLREYDRVYLVANRSGSTYRIAAVDVREQSSSRNRGRSTDDLTIYRGELQEVDTRWEQIVLRSGTVSYLDGGSWRSQSGRQELDLAPGVDIYTFNNLISLNRLEDYTGRTVYVVYDEYAKEVLHIRVREIGVTEDGIYREEIRYIDTRRQEIELYGTSRVFEYDRGSVAILDDRLSYPDQLYENEYIYMIVNRSGSTYKAIIMVLR